LAVAASTSAAEEVLARARGIIVPVLDRWAAEVSPPIAYSLRSTGKCLRGALVLESYRAVGGSGPAVSLLAAAVEMLHGYSLIHDDLPCMDDAALRRGRATTHRVFGVEAATRAGFAMIPLAAHYLGEVAADLPLGPSQLSAVAGELFRAVGAGGMIGGQYLDLESEGRELDVVELARMHRAKTGALIAASCVVGGLAAGAAGDSLAGLRRYGEELGLAFQIADDVLDAVGTTSEIGKTAGQDAARAKATFVTTLGAAEAAAEATRRTRVAVDALRAARLSSKPLEVLATFVAERRS